MVREKERERDRDRDRDRQRERERDRQTERERDRQRGELYEIYNKTYSLLTFRVFSITLVFWS